MPVPTAVAAAGVDRRHVELFYPQREGGREHNDSCSMFGSFAARSRSPAGSEHGAAVVTARGSGTDPNGVGAGRADSGVGKSTVLSARAAGGGTGSWGGGGWGLGEDYLGNGARRCSTVVLEGRHLRVARDGWIAGGKRPRRSVETTSWNELNVRPTKHKKRDAWAPHINFFFFFHINLQLVDRVVLQHRSCPHPPCGGRTMLSRYRPAQLPSS